MGGVLAELLAREGFAVTLATPATEVSDWTAMTMEQASSRRGCMELGVGIECNRVMRSIVRDGEIETACAYHRRPHTIAAGLCRSGHGAPAGRRALSSI